MNAKENLIRAISKESPEYVPCYAWNLFEGDLPLRSINYKGNSVGFGKEGVDWWGCHWAPMGSEGESIDMMYPFPVKVPLDKIKKIDDYRFPDPDGFELREESRQLLQGVDRNEVLLFGCDEHCLMERAQFSCGMENLLLALYTEPGRVKKLLHGIANYHIGIAKHFLALGIDGFYTSDDLGGQSQMFVKPDMWREFFKPEMKRILEPYKAAGKVVFLHSCGHIMEVVADLIGIGVDILHPIQARANDLKELKQKYGDRICFCGGIDTQCTLARGTTAEVERETIERLKDLGPGGGYIAGPDQKMSLPKENVEALVKMVKKYGKYPLRFDADS